MYDIIIINVLFVTATAFNSYTLMTALHGYIYTHGTTYGNNLKCSWRIRLPSSVKKVSYYLQNSLNLFNHFDHRPLTYDLATYAEDIMQVI